MTRNLKPAAGILLVGLLGILTGTAQAIDLPLEKDSRLQASLEAGLKDLGYQSAVRTRKLSVALVIMDEESPRVAMVNGHRMMYAASLPKIAILYGAAIALDRERLKPSKPLANDINQMIRRSCNRCATRVLALVGRDWLLNLLQSPPYPFYDPELGGGLWVGKDYAKANAYKRDPLKNLSHAATAWQTARWYWLLQSGELASEKQTQMMLDALVNPALHHKFVHGLKGLVNRDKIYRKSGTWTQFHSDSVMVTQGNTRYILVGLAESREGGKWLEKIAPMAHQLVIESTGSTATATGSD